MADGINTDRYYSSILNGTNTTGKVYDAVFADEDEGDLSVNDFFDMMITQLTNQDFMNPVDDTQYLAQMAQFSTMQEMMDLCQYSKQNYVMSMLGKEVTLSRDVIGGETKNTTGVVEKILLEDDEYKIYVNGQPYDLSKVTQIFSEGVSNNTETETEGEGSDKTETQEPVTLNNMTVRNDNNADG